MREFTRVSFAGIVFGLVGGVSLAQVDPAAAPAAEPPSRAIPENYVSGGPLHRVVAKPGDALIGALRAAGR